MKIELELDTFDAAALEEIRATIAADGIEATAEDVAKTIFSEGLSYTRWAAAQKEEEDYCNFASCLYLVKHPELMMEGKAWQRSV